MLIIELLSSILPHAYVLQCGCVPGANSAIESMSSRVLTSWPLLGISLSHQEDYSSALWLMRSTCFSCNRMVYLILLEEYFYTRCNHVDEEESNSVIHQCILKHISFMGLVWPYAPCPTIKLLLTA